MKSSLERSTEGIDLICDDCSVSYSVFPLELSVMLRLLEMVSTPLWGKEVITGTSISKVLLEPAGQLYSNSDSILDGSSLEEPKP